MTEPENLILHMLRDIREKMATKTDLAELRSEIADVRSEVRSLRADVASDLLDLEQRLGGRIDTVEKRLGDQIGGLRRSVMEYHSSVIGHGVLYGELEERVGRIEQHLKLEPAEKH